MQINISVVIPFYNRVEFVHNCVMSVLKQTYPVCEIILIDDASTNTITQTDLKKIGSNKVKLIRHKENQGAQIARSTGIQNAIGEWIAFLDSDDEWLPNKLELQVQALQTQNYNPYVVIHGDGIRVDFKNGQKTDIILPLIHGNQIESRKALLKHPSCMFPAIMTSKKALIEINLLDSKVKSHQEWDTALELSKICSFVHLREPLFYYNIHEGTAISKNIQNKLAGYEYIVNKNKNEIIETHSQEDFHFHIRMLITICLQYKKYNKAKEYISKQKSDFTREFLALRLATIFKFNTLSTEYFINTKLFELLFRILVKQQ